MNALNAIGIEILGAGGGSGAAARRPATRLNLDRNNSPNETIELRFVPQYSGGRLDLIGGYGKRIFDLKRIMALESRMKYPAILTLTIDRSGFASPKDAYEYAMKRLSKLLTERLGLRTWARVIEVQTKSGDGWIHWHIVIDLAESSGMKFVAATVWRNWKHKWGIGGCDLQRIRKSVAGYLATYITKAWPAIPPWMGESDKRFRIVGFSKRAGEVIRNVLGLLPRVSRPKLNKRKYRKTRTLFSRLANSGLSTAVIAKCGDTGHYVGTLRANVADMMLSHQQHFLPGVALVLEKDEAKDNQVRMRLVMPSVRSGDEDRVFRGLRRAIRKRGLSALCDSLYMQRIDALRLSWPDLQCRE